VNRQSHRSNFVSPEDEKYLRLVLTHTCGWSATYPEQMHAPWWADFFPVSYSQLKGLVPILDSMAYLKELVDFPDEYGFRAPRFFLLATPDCYFVYDVTDGVAGLFIAGKALGEVYQGLKDWMGWIFWRSVGLCGRGGVWAPFVSHLLPERKRELWELGHWCQPWRVPRKSSSRTFTEFV